MDNPKISVIVPVYNPGRHFRKCLDSLVNQTYSNLEIILIDDGSADGSEIICDEYAAADSRITVIHQLNSGVSKARNTGLAVATGDFVSFPDSDDYIEPDTYEYLLEQISDADADAVCFEYYITYPESEKKHTANDMKYGLLNREESVYELLFSNRSFLCTKLLPMKAVKNLRFYEDIYRDEDTIFCMFALHNISSTLFVDKPLYHYVQSEESACRGVFRPSQLSAVKAIPVMEEFLGKYYPKMVGKWRCNYMHLMIMLYCDMYLEPESYRAEKETVFSCFLMLKNGVSKEDICSVRDRVKFFLFGKNPALFCRIHKRIHRL